MRWNAALTWESDTRPPESFAVTVQAESVATAAARALRLGQRLRPGKRFTSVLLLLERADAEQDGEA